MKNVQIIPGLRSRIPEASIFAGAGAWSHAFLPELQKNLQAPAPNFLKRKTLPKPSKRLYNCLKPGILTLRVSVGKLVIHNSFSMCVTTVYDFYARTFRRRTFMPRRLAAGTFRLLDFYAPRLLGARGKKFFFSKKQVFFQKKVFFSKQHFYYKKTFFFPKNFFSFK